jgi:SAM-dependent methyltransferase
MGAAIARRPFYTEFAWAYDLLIDRPVRKECGAITTWLVERGIVPGAFILDAGCGTGRYSLELVRRGYIVEGIDASPEQIAEARRSADMSTAVSWTIGDISNLPGSAFDAILCRGVLNDLLTDRDRDAVFSTFARALRPSGVLIFDVREWEATRARKMREPLFRKRVATDRGWLTFSSMTTLEPTRRELQISERHTLESGGEARAVDFQFVMRCWTQDELHVLLTRAGFESISWFGAYDHEVVAGATDRLVVVAQHQPMAQEDRVQSTSWL